MLEQLEDRTLMAGDLLLTAEVPGQLAYNLMDYTQQGAQVSALKIPPPTGQSGYQAVRGLSVDPSGNVQVIDGAPTPTLATLPPDPIPSWSFQTVSGWGLGGNLSYGEVAAYKNFVFASNVQSASGGSNGIIRFDTTGGPPVLFASGTTAIQLTLGLDGRLYELVNSGSLPNSDPIVEVFNPDTLALVRTFHLTKTGNSDIRSIAVDGAGNIYGADWSGSVTQYNSNGAAIKTQTGYSENLMNIALDNDGQIAVGGRLGGVYLTDESLSSLRSFQTNQWNVFVTFDHYIGTAPQTVTPSFSALAGPTITYGQSSVTLGGTISAGSTFPPGSVNISVNGVTQSAAISSTDGTFSAVFDPSTLGVSGSPYTITYSYPAQSNYNAITDTSKTLTVNPAATTLTKLSSPSIGFGTPTTTLSGVVGSNSVLPVGQSVSVFIVGSSGPVAGGSGTIDANGQFTININTATLATGSYTINYVYGGDSNFITSSDNSATLTVLPAPAVTTNPTNQTVVAGQTATFTAAASGNPAPTVQWQVSSDKGQTWTNISGATSTTLTLSNVLASLTGSEYRAVFSNSVGSGTTAAAVLTVQTAPVITSGNNLVLSLGLGGSFIVTATGNPTPSLAVSGALPTGLTFTDNGNGTAILAGAPAAGTQGTYHFTFTAHNGVGSDATQSFTLMVSAGLVPSAQASSSSTPGSVQQQPTLKVPPLLAFLNTMFGGVESVNANNTEMFTTSIFGVAVFVATYDGSGNFISATAFGFKVPNWIWFV